jgi:chloride channel protein, CIC family
MIKHYSLCDQHGGLLAWFPGESLSPAMVTAYEYSQNHYGWKKSMFLNGLKPLGSSEQTTMGLLALIVGITSGLGVVGFEYLIRFFQKLAYGSADEFLSVLLDLPWYRYIWVPTVGGLVVGPIIFFMVREAKGQGVPDVMEAVALRGGIIRKRVVAIKTLASAISIGLGGSVGREGPIVQIGSAIGSAIGQMLNVSPGRLRTLVGCGAAGGIAATFNAPIAGSMFALEVILGDFGVATFSPIVISAVTATAISRAFLGDFPAFFVPPYSLVSAWEFPLYFLLGAVCAVVGVTFTRGLYKAEDVFDQIPIPEYLKASVGGMILGCIALIFPHVLGVGYGGIDMALMQDLGWFMMLTLVFVKILATSLTLGSGFSGGIFAPSLFIGAMAGGAFGSLIHPLLPAYTASPGAYAIVGMAAVVSATTHGPLTAILILFEMTGDYKIILPLMITCIVSCLLAGRLFKESIFSMKLTRRGVDIRAGREVNILKGIRVRDVMNPEVETVTHDMKIEKLAETITRSKFNSFPVLDDRGCLSGILSYQDYSEVLFNPDLKDLVVAGDIASSPVVTVTTEDNLHHAMELFTRRDFSIIPVVDPADGCRLVGVLTRRDIIGAYDKAVIKQGVLSRETSG